MKSLQRLPLGLLLLLLPLVPFSSAFAADATVRLVGQFRSEKPNTCFRIKPVNGSFDVRNVTLSSIKLLFHDGSLAPLEGSARLQFDCEHEDSLGEGDGEGDHGGCDSTGHHDDAARLRLDGGFPGHDEGDSTDDDCEDCNADSCNAVGIRVCFSTQDLLTFFGDASLPDSLADATVQFTLADGSTVVGTFDVSHLTEHGHGEAEGRGLDAKARPNPLNPRTELTFTLSRAGRVQVAVYDLQGRLVTKLLDEVRSAGPQSLTWDGSNSRSARVASGVYYFRIQAPQGQVTQRVAVVK
jgi:hypothetical protein